MNITTIRTDAVYRRMISAATNEERENIFRDELVQPFAFKWQCLGIPLKAEQAGGYDAVSAITMGGGYHPTQITKEHINEIEKISSDSFWDTCIDSIKQSLEGFEQRGIILPVQEYNFEILLNDPQNPMSAFTGDCCGEGGIPGYIVGTIIPNENSLKMMPAVLAHETNHNVRWQFMQWSANVTVADMIISEGLAENFAAAMYGEDKIGKWVSSTTQEMLETVIKPLIKVHLDENDFIKVTSYLYGDEIMAMRGAAPLGVPYCAGYACGYWLIKHYMKKTGKDIFEATVCTTADILKETEDFWS